MPGDWDGRERRANVDSLSERLTGHMRFDDERWEGHKDKHLTDAETLRDYKTAANEWRATLADVRGSMLSRAEWVAEHKALVATTASDIDRLEVRMGAIERSQQTMTDRQLVTRDNFGTIRNLVVLGFTIMGGLVGLAIYLRA